MAPPERTGEPDAVEVRAAGGVVWRRCGDGVEIAVIHRPKYDDWSFPKGKLDPGEDWLNAAVREVFEEIDVVAVPRQELASTSYRDHKGRAKLVRYWEMTVAAELAFRADDEVDELRWLSRDRVRMVLTHDHDRDVLDSLPAAPASAGDER